MWEYFGFFMLLTGIIMPIVMTTRFSRLMRKNENGIREVVLHEINEILRPQFVYDIEKATLRTDFEKALFFPAIAVKTSYVAGHLAYGKHAGQVLQFSDVRYYYNVSVRTKQDRHNVKTYIFNGLFTIVHNNEVFPKPLICLPANLRYIANSRTGSCFQGISMKLIENQNVEYFQMFSDSDEAAAAMVSRKNLQTIVKDFLAKNPKCRVYISFLGSKTYIAVDYPDRLFDIRWTKSVHKSNAPEVVADIYEFVLNASKCV